MRDNTESVDLQIPTGGWRNRDLWFENLFLWTVSFLKIPMLFFLRPRIVATSWETTIVKIPFRRRSKNHLNCMYFGAICTGIDAAGGFLAAKISRAKGNSVNILFKDVHGEFLKRAESDVYFVCAEGKLITELVDRALASGERINQVIHIDAMVRKGDKFELVAKFTTTLSLRKKKIS